MGARRTVVLVLLSVTNVCCEGQLLSGAPPPRLTADASTADGGTEMGGAASAPSAASPAPDAGSGGDPEPAAAGAGTDAGEVAAEDAGAGRESDAGPLSSGAAAGPSAFVVGPWHAPLEDVGETLRWSGTTHTSSAGDLGRTIESLRASGARATISVPRAAMKNPDGTLSVSLTRAELASWRDAADVDPYFVDGTVIAIVVMDDATGAAWGGRAPTAAEVDSIAGAVKELWPHARVAMRQKPAWGAPYAWRYMDLAWAQYNGPYRDGAPESYAAQNVRDARAAHLGLILGLNTLDGGCGPVSLGACLPDAPGTSIEGTYEAATSVRRFQMTAAEMLRYGQAFLDETYNCALLGWRYSITYPASSHTTPEQFAAIVAFDARPDVIDAWARLVALGRARRAGTCSNTR